MRVHGCTVHFVTPVLDHGPIIAQGCVPVLAGDTPEALAERVLAVAAAQFSGGGAVASPRRAHILTSDHRGERARAIPDAPVRLVAGRLDRP